MAALSHSCNNRTDVPRRTVTKDRTAEREAVYANRRRLRGVRGKRLLRKRGELLERPFAHCYETGGMRRTHLQTHARILKRLLIHVAGCNLGLVMRTLFGLSTPRGLQGLASAFLPGWVRLARTLGHSEEPVLLSRWRFRWPSAVWHIPQPGLLAS